MTQIITIKSTTPRLRRVFQFAYAQADALNHDYVGVEHMLLALIQEKEGLHADVWRTLGFDTELMESRIRELLQTPPAALAKAESERA